MLIAKCRFKDANNMQYLIYCSKYGMKPTGGRMWDDWAANSVRLCHTRDGRCQIFMLRCCIMPSFLFSVKWYLTVLIGFLSRYLTEHFSDIFRTLMVICDWLTLFAKGVSEILLDLDSMLMLVIFMWATPKGLFFSLKI